MKQLKIRKSKLAQASVLTLIVLALSVATIKNITDTNYLKSEISSLKQNGEQKDKKIASIELDLRSINGGNGNLLSKCLDTAGREYNNTIKSSGRTVVENGSNVTYQDMSTWKKANDKLEAARQSCNEQYK